MLKYYEEGQRRMLAFASASHRRLGSGSSAHLLSPELHEVVARNILPPRYIPTFHSVADLSRPELLEGRLPSEAIYTNLSENGASLIELEIFSPDLKSVLYKEKMPMFSSDGGHEQQVIPGYFLYIKEHYHVESPPSNFEKVYDVMLLIYLPSDHQFPSLKIDTIICTASLVCEMMAGAQDGSLRFPLKLFDSTTKVGQRLIRTLYFNEPCIYHKGEKFTMSFLDGSFHLVINPNQNFSPSFTPWKVSFPGFPC